MNKTKKRKKGRPSKRTQKNALKICNELAKGKSLKKTCKELNIDIITVLDWLNKDKDFLSKYTRAKEESADSLADEILESANSAEQIDFHDLDGKTANARVNARRLKIDALKWIACKLKPKRYGDRISAEYSGVDGGAINQVITVKFVK